MENSPFPTPLVPFHIWGGGYDENVKYSNILDMADGQNSTKSKN